MPALVHIYRRSMFALVFVLALPSIASAQGLVRDAGMEHALNMLARPILTAAGLPANRTRVLVVNDMSMNAFVVDSRAVFIHAGLLLRLDSADEVQAVIAHEVAHIANNHFARRRLNAQTARTATIAGIVGAVAAGIATGDAGIGAGIAAGTAGSAQRVFFSHTRAEEAAADKSGMRYLAMAGIDPKALRGVLDLFKGQELLTVARQDPYAQSHPLSRDRIRAVEQTSNALRPRTSDRDAAAYWFGRAQGKLSAYLRSPGYTLNKVGTSDTSDAAHMQRALAYFKQPDLAAARREMAVLLERKPDDAYFQELSGWIELESGKIGPAVAAYEVAAELAPREPLILAGYGRALLAQNTRESNAKALEALITARSRDRYDPHLLRDLGVAYARAGNNGMASLATAQRYALFGRMKDAELHAKRAAGQLPVGSPGWSRAQDVIRAAEADKKRR